MRSLSAIFIRRNQCCPKIFLLLISEFARNQFEPCAGLSPSQRAAALLAEMNITEKIDMLHGWDGPYVGNVIANTRLNIPSLNLNDGPQVHP